jgi:uncharacterized protein (UPF0276 family)
VREIQTGISLFDSEAQRAAAYPLFEAGLIEAIEWTIDLGWQEPVTEWATALLKAYGDAGRLYGHGVTMSPTSRHDNARTRWLERMAVERHRYRHVIEHWGFSRARGIARGAPLPLVASEAVVQSTATALRQLASAARTHRVGLENLALALSDDDVDAQPAMIARTLDAVDGILLLDLHNVWCQAMNYGRDVRELVARYPLARVRQLHVAGGSWSNSTYGKPFRRDTHDELAPREVLELLAWTIPRCPALEVVILERLPDTLSDAYAWRTEFQLVADIVRRATSEPVIAPRPLPVVTLPTSASADDVGRLQDAMVAVFLSERDARAARSVLLAHPDAQVFRDQIASWAPRAIEVAITLANKWSVRAS